MPHREKKILTASHNLQDIFLTGLSKGGFPWSRSFLNLVPNQLDKYIVQVEKLHNIP